VDTTSTEAPAPKIATVIVREKGTANTALVHGANIVSGVVRSLPRRGTPDLLRAYSESPMLQAIVRKISMTIAKVQWKAGVRGLDGEFVEVPNHLASKLLNSGVPGLDGFSCKMVEQQGFELAGETFGLIERNRFGAPEWRYPLPSHWVANTPSPAQEFFEIRTRNGTAHTMVHRNDMLWHKDVDPYDPYRRGVGISRSLNDELSTDEAAAKHAAASLMNRARPDIIISGTKEMPLGKDAAERLHTVWQQRFGGAENQGKPFVSLAPITVEQLTPTFAELQLTTLREFERDILVSVFGVPPEIMGIIENANRATIESAEFLFMKHVIEPRLAARKSSLQDQLAWQYDERLIIEHEGVISEDMEFKLKVMQSRPKAFSKDEVRALANEQPLPDGAGAMEAEGGGVSLTDENVQASAMNGAQIQALQGIITSVAEGKLPPGAAKLMIIAGFPTIGEEQAQQMVDEAAAFELPEEEPPVPPPGLPAPQPGGADAAEADPDLGEGPPPPVPAEAEQRGASAGAVHKAIDPHQIEEIMSAFDDTLVQTVLVRNARSTIAEFSSEAIETLLLDIDFDIEAPRVVAFLDNIAGERSALMNGTTRKNLRATLSEGVGLGENLSKLQDRVMAAVVDAGAVRAETIARTEIVRASNFATEEAFLQAGVTEKEWLATQDDRTRDSHAEMDGQKVPVGEDFVSPDGYSAQYPGDFGVAEEDINCRCSIVSVDSAPEKGMRVAAFQKIEGGRASLEADLEREMNAAFIGQAERILAKLKEAT